GTHGRGAWQVNLVTGIAEPSLPPTTFALNQNYPNPFNPATMISYSIPRASDVNIDVYNVLGQRVRSMSTGFQPAGEHTVEFNASTLPSGVYFYTVRFGGMSLTKKMVLLK
ncbi:MAG TPA: T9SS type A sorting domain-containing protein, partial [Candidatus Kryptobacter bacterium]|nr:T9SS type A sorting domain-containing protein [Candidatus Kryptobacter bacterium]